MGRYEFNQQLVGSKQPLQAFALNLTRNREDAQDLVQETCYRAITNREKFNDGTNMKAWLMTIMKNIFINDYRRAVKRKEITGERENNFHIDASLHYALNQAERNFIMNDLSEAVDHLDGVYKKPFLMHFEGFKYEEIAEECNLPLGTVKSRIFFARKYMQEYLAAKGFSKN